MNTKDTTCMEARFVWDFILPVITRNHPGRFRIIHDLTTDSFGALGIPTFENYAKFVNVTFSGAPADNILRGDFTVTDYVNRRTWTVDLKHTPYHKYGSITLHCSPDAASVIEELEKRTFDYYLSVKTNPDGTFSNPALFFRKDVINLIREHGLPKLRAGERDNTYYLCLKDFESVAIPLSVIFDVDF